MRISDWSSDVCSSDLGFRGCPRSVQTEKRPASGRALIMFTLFRLVRIIFVALRYRLDELVLSSIKHPLAHGLLYTVRLARRPKTPPAGRLCLAPDSLGPTSVNSGRVFSPTAPRPPQHLAT